MNATELFHADGRSADVFYCEACRLVKRTRGEAEACCTPHICRYCDEPVQERYRTVHPECSSKAAAAEWAEKKRQYYAMAERVTEWDGPVFWDDRFCFDWEALEDAVDDRLADHPEEDPPDWVWCSRPNHPRPLNLADDYLERLIEDCAPDSDPDWDVRPCLDGLEELQAAIDHFNTLNAEKELSYACHYGKIVLLSWEKQDDGWTIV